MTGVTLKTRARGLESHLRNRPGQNQHRARGEDDERSLREVSGGERTCSPAADSIISWLALPQAPRTIWHKPIGQEHGIASPEDAVPHRGAPGTTRVDAHPALMNDRVRSLASDDRGERILGIWLLWCERRTWRTPWCHEGNAPSIDTAPLRRRLDRGPRVRANAGAPMRVVRRRRIRLGRTVPD